MLNSCLYSRNSRQHLHNSLKTEEDIIRICSENGFNEIKVATLYSAFTVLDINFPPQDVYSQKALKYLRMGFKLAKKYGFNVEAEVLRMELLSKEVTIDNSHEKLEIIGSIYKNLKKYSPAGIWTVRALSSYANCLVRFKPDKFNKMLNRLTKVRILRQQMANAMYNIYVNKSMPDNDASLDLGVRQKYVILDNVKVPELDKRNEMTDKMIRELRNIHHSNGRVYILLNRLHSEFLKGAEYDFEKAALLIRKIEWFKKTKEVKNDILGNYYELIKLGLKMFDESFKYDARYDVLNKFQMKFAHLCDDIIQKNNRSLNLTKVYLMISFIARRLNYPEIWAIVQKQWDYLHQNHPTITKSLKSHLKKQNRQKAA